MMSGLLLEMDLSVCICFFYNIITVIIIIIIIIIITHNNRIIQYVLLHFQNSLKQTANCQEVTK
jgi:hypothetical protein